jgi:hypothetical protein
MTEKSHTGGSDKTKHMAPPLICVVSISRMARDQSQNISYGYACSLSNRRTCAGYGFSRLSDRSSELLFVQDYLQNCWKF